MAILTHNFNNKAKVRLLASALSIVGGIIAHSATAQETAQQEEKAISVENKENSQEIKPEIVILEEIVVYGQKASLQNAQTIKRDADTFVDAISAADIGALPDRSVLEALQRLPGVSIERFASSDDPDRFSAEGSGAVVRGMTATRTEFNGRDSFTANSGRGLSFQDVPPELMGSVKLYKNQSADLIEGGIGGTVSLYTRQPFDSEERILAFSADYTYFDLSGDKEPSLSGLYSEKWDTDIGEVGVLIGLARGKSSTRSDGIQSEVFNTRTDFENGKDANGQYIVPDVAIYPSGANIGIKHDERLREGLSLAFQWRNPDETMEATATAMRSDSKLRWEERKISVGAWDTTRGDQTRPMTGSQFTFDNSGSFVTGIIGHGNSEWRTGPFNSPDIDRGYLDALRYPRGEDRKGNDKISSLCFDNDPANNIYVTDPGTGDPTGVIDTAAMEARLVGLYCNERAPVFGRRMSSTARIYDQRTLVDDYAFNFKYTPNEKWEFIADLQYIEALTANTDFTLGLGSSALVYSNVSGDVPTMALINPWDGVAPDTKQNLASLGQGVIADQNQLIEDGEEVSTPYIPIDRNDPKFFSNKSSYYWDFAQDHNERSEGDEIALRLDTSYFIEDNFFTAIKMGVRYSQREQLVRSDNYNWGTLDQPRGKKASASDEYYAGWADMVASDQVQSYNWKDFFHGDNAFRGIATAGPDGLSLTNDFNVLLPSMSLVEDYRNSDINVSPIVDPEGDKPWVPGWLRDKKKGATLGENGKLNNDGKSDGIPDTIGFFLPEEISDIREENRAIYLRADFESDRFKFPISGNLGIRYYRVNLDTNGYTVFPDLISTNQDPADAIKYNGDQLNFLPDDQKAFGNNIAINTPASNSYGHILPSLNLKVEFSDELLGRFAVSKAVSLPDIGDLRSYVTIRAILDEPVYAEDDRPNEVKENDTLYAPPIESAEVQVWTASAGNPFLEPMESIQFDASLEWYFADVGSLTGSVFYKDLSNFFVDGAFPRAITNPSTNSTQVVNVQSKTNSPHDGSLQGFEIAYQQYFDMLPYPYNGFGTQLNYTLIDVSGVPNPPLTLDIENPDDVDLRSGSQVATLPLQSQSKHTMNVAFMYEQGPISLRTAYNWRSEYLVTARDASNYPYPATWAKSAGYLDASAFYSITDEIKIGLQGTNLLNTIAETEYQDLATGDTHGRSWFANDRRYALVLRAVF